MIILVPEFSIIKFNGLVFDLLCRNYYLHVSPANLIVPFSVLRVVSGSKIDLVCSLGGQKEKFT
jgi:hypothetical protein